MPGKMTKMASEQSEVKTFVLRKVVHMLVQQVSRRQSAIFYRLISQPRNHPYSGARMVRSSSKQMIWCKNCKLKQNFAQFFNVLSHHANLHTVHMWGHVHGPEASQGITSSLCLCDDQLMKSPEDNTKLASHLIGCPRGSLPTHTCSDCERGP